MHLRGTHGAMDARVVAKGMKAFLDLLAALETGEADGHSRCSSWALSRLKEGSAQVGVAPLVPYGDTSYEELERIQRLAVEGFRVAEVEERLPPGWPAASGEKARQWAELLGTTADSGMRLTFLRDGREELVAEVTKRTATNLGRALRTKYRSIGSVVGTIRSVTLQSGRSAGLWLDGRNKNHRVKVVFAESDLELVRRAFGRRVVVRGELSRNAKGQILKVDMRSIEVLPTADQAPPLTDLVGGHPGITEGLGSVEYVRKFRDAA